MAKTDKQRTWAKRIAAWERSGMSRRPWCAANEANVHTFDYWRRRLRARSAGSSVLPGPGIAVGELPAERGPK
jgi:hypothetical protein